MANWKTKIPHCFAGGKFAVQRTEQDAAFDLLAQLRKEGIGWSVVQQELKNFLKNDGCRPDWLLKQMVRIREHFKSWLEP